MANKIIEKNVMAKSIIYEALIEAKGLKIEHVFCGFYDNNQ